MNMEKSREEKSRASQATGASAERIDLEDFTVAVLRGVQRATEARDHVEGAAKAASLPTSGRLLFPRFPIIFGLILDPRWPPGEFPGGGFPGGEVPGGAPRPPGQ